MRVSLDKSEVRAREKPFLQKATPFIRGHSRAHGYFTKLITVNSIKDEPVALIRLRLRTLNNLFQAIERILPNESHLLFKQNSITFAN